MDIFKNAAIIVVILLIALSAEIAISSSSQPVSTAKTIKPVIPIYKPPLRGAPVGRIGGGTRGVSQRESFSLQVLAPNHIGNTTEEQPCLYWYISNPIKHPIELTVTERKAVKPLLEKTLTVSEQGRIKSVCLGDYGVRLRKNTPYKWFVTLVIDPDHRSKDILAGGMLTVVDQPPTLVEKLKSKDKAGLLNIYAAEGLWYDAIDAVSKMIATSPDNSELRKWRASLLEQVGLTEVATHENDRIE